MPTDYLKDLMTKVKASKRKPGEAESAAPPSKVAAAKKPVAGEKAAAAEEILQAMRQTSTIPAKAPEAGEEAVPAGEAMQLVEGQKSQVEKELEETKTKTEVASYGDVRIFRLPDKPLLYYFVPVPKAAASERTIINTLKEAATRLISIQPYRIRDQAQRRIIYKQKIEEILKSSPELKIPRGRFDFYIDAVVREMVGYGLIDQLVQDDRLEEIMIIGPKKPVFVFHRDFEMMATNIEFFSDDEVQDLINRIAREVGRRVDLSAPLLDARLPDGSRVNATIPPASVSGSTLTIRKFREDPYSIVDLINFGTINAEVAAFLWLCVEGMSVRPANVLISGGTGSGKTTLLNVMASFIPENERVITIEDTAELNLPLNHWIRLEAKPPGLEGKGELTMDILTKNSLRMRPDRIIVGEIRHAEAFSLFTAMNTGHDGCLTFDTKIPFPDGIEEIGTFVDGLIEMKGSRKEGEWQIVDVDGKEINSLDDSGKMQREKVVEARRKPYAGKVRHIRLASGAEITVTPNHPFYTFDGKVVQTAAGNLEEAMFVATPARLYRNADAVKPEIEYWSGLLHGDGHILDYRRKREKNGKQYECNEGRVSLFTEDERIIPEFSAFMKKEFDGTHVGVRPASPEKNCFEVSVSGIVKSRKAQQLFAIPAGPRNNALVSNSHFCSSLNEFVAGFFDAEGHVDLENNALVFTCGNEHYIDFVRYALLTEGIVSRKYESRTANSRWFRLYVYGLENVRKFSAAFPLKYPEKLKKLELLLSKPVQPNTNVDVVPCNALIAKMVAEAQAKGISERAIARLAGVSQGLLRFFRLGQRMPSKESVKKLAVAFKAAGIEADGLEQLASSEIFWDRITHIHEFDYSGFVYDLTVGEKEASGLKPHNFVAESIIVGNSLGSVHANSAQETLVRVTSPPMNVPPLMLSGLDFVIIEHRLHDRQKGTIRRLTEISEVSGVLQGKAQTQELFKWNPVDDSFERTSVPSAYLKMLGDFSGLKKKQLDDEISERERFLKELVKLGIRGMPEVSAKLQAFLDGRAKK